MKKQHVKLNETDRQCLDELICRGQHSAKLYKRAVALLELDRGQTYARVAEIVGVTQQTVSAWAKTFQEMGLRCLQDKALACSDPPEGYSQWSLRLLADKAVELEYCEHISHNTVKQILKKTNSSLT
jgi:putative transposase